MSRFTDCLPIILQYEGGYVDHPLDPGGATNMGVTQRVYDSYRNRAGKGTNPVVGISRDEVAEIYKREYWDRCQCDRLPKPLDLVAFDSAVNHGVKQASKFVQRALGVDDDGIIGPQTIDAALKDEASGMMPSVIAAMINQRQEFYNLLVSNNPKLGVFLNGWMHRIDRLAAECM